MLSVNVLTDNSFQRNSLHGARIITEKSLDWFDSLFRVKTEICFFPGAWKEELPSIETIISDATPPIKNLTGNQLLLHLLNILRGLNIHPYINTRKEDYLLRKLNSSSPETRINNAVIFLSNEILAELVFELDEQRMGLLGQKDATVIGFTGRMFPLLDSFDEITEGIASPYLKCAVVAANENVEHVFIHEFLHILGAKDQRPKAPSIMSSISSSSLELDYANKKRILKALVVKEKIIPAR